MKCLSLSQSKKSIKLWRELCHEAHYRKTPQLNKAPPFCDFVLIIGPIEAIDLLPSDRIGLLKDDSESWRIGSAVRGYFAT